MLLDICLQYHMWIAACPDLQVGLRVTRRISIWRYNFSKGSVLSRVGHGEFITTLWRKRSLISKSLQLSSDIFACKNARLNNFNSSPVGSKLFLFSRSFPVFLYYLSDSASLRLVTYSVRSAESLKHFMETPFDRFFNWLVEDKGQEGYSSKTELYWVISDLAYT